MHCFLLTRSPLATAGQFYSSLTPYIKGAGYYLAESERLLEIAFLP